MIAKDRDRMIELFVFYDFLDEWVKDTETYLRPQDKNKIKNICQITKQLIVQYGKQEGIKAVETLLEEANKYKFAIINKDEKVEFTDSFETNILKTAMKKVLKGCTQCDLCEREDFKYCEWYTINKFLNSEQVNKKKKDCPFRNNIDNIFNVEGEEL